MRRFDMLHDVILLLPLSAFPRNLIMVINQPLKLFYLGCVLALIHIIAMEVYFNCSPTHILPWTATFYIPQWIHGSRLPTNRKR
jgi:hypothetical protein